MAPAPPQKFWLGILLFLGLYDFIEHKADHIDHVEPEQAAKTDPHAEWSASRGEASSDESSEMEEVD